MKRFRWELMLGIYLVILSAVIYFTHYLIFGDSHHIFIYLLGDIAFVPIEVLLVTLIIHRLLEVREKKKQLEKLNMVIESFFSETGSEILRYASDHDPDVDVIKRDLLIKNNWTKKDFAQATRKLRDYNFNINIKHDDLPRLKSYLIEKRGFMLRLLENPVLLEHESFTELMRAIFHLTEELANRDDPSTLPESDLQHLKGDMKRAYGLLVREWLLYMKYLKSGYPYLFSLAVRINPFDSAASAIVR
jgi:hypothetical protein